MLSTGRPKWSLSFHFVLGRLQSPERGGMGDHQPDQRWNGILTFKNCFWSQNYSFIVRRCLKLSTCAVRAFSSPSATCSPPRMTKRSASFSTNCPDLVLAGWCCPWWRQQHTGNCGKACRGWQGDSQHSTLSLSGFLLKGRNDGGRVWRTR